jgi:hypothetical protein
MRKRSLLLSIGFVYAKPAFALYDPKPSDLLAPAIGSWRGTLTYADYQSPGKLVTLPTRLVVTLVGPDELSLYYVFDDGPGKIVYSYERMAIDQSRTELTWISGVTKPKTSKYRIKSAIANNEGASIDFDQNVDSGTDTYTLEITGRTWRLGKREARAGKQDLQRSKYDFTRT